MLFVCVYVLKLSWSEIFFTSVSWQIFFAYLRVFGEIKFLRKIFILQNQTLYERISLKFNLVQNLMPPNDLVVREIKSLRKICNPLSPLSVFIYVLWENPRIFFHQNKFWKYSIIGNESQNNYFAKVFLAWFWDDKKKTPLFYVLQNRGKFLKPKVDFFYLYDTVYFNIFIQDYIYNDTLKRFEKKRFI